jgi:hypothetical protein
MTVDFPKLGKVSKDRPMGKHTPWAWVLEAVHGCNLRCGHCSHALDPPGAPYEFMEEDVWRAAWETHVAVSPTSRVDVCLSGEPTLHPRLPNLLRIARRISPRSQIQITTNGTTLRSGRVTYTELLDAGANIVYTDMYGPKRDFERMARESGVPWYRYYDAPEGAPSPWTYHGPDLKVIVLQEQPENWPASRFRAGLLGTWYNHLDWEKARRFGLSPVVEAPKRRCNQPFVYVPVHVSGAYLLCCQDNWGETAGQFGNVLEGREGFDRYWFGRNLQIIRRRLRNKNRRDTVWCSRCCITFSRCDYIHWKHDQLKRYWTGTDWLSLYPGGPDPTERKEHGE